MLLPLLLSPVVVCYHRSTCVITSLTSSLEMGLKIPMWRANSILLVVIEGGGKADSLYRAS